MKGMGGSTYKEERRKPVLGGGGSQQMAGLSALMGMMIGQQKAQQAKENIGEDISDIRGQFEGEIPVGSTFSTGAQGPKVNVPLNRELSPDELASVSAYRSFTPIVDELKKEVASGTLGRSSGFLDLFDNTGRTYNQWAVGQPNAIFTSSSPSLQKVQGLINSLRRYVFGEGGKQLTPYEANIVNALIKPFGKSDQQYLRDLDETIRIITEKQKLALGGQAYAETPFEGQEISQGDQTGQEDEEALIQSILERTRGR